MTGTFINNRKYLYLYLIEEKVHFQRPIRPLFAFLNYFIIQKKYIYRSALTENFDNLRRCIPKAKLCKNVNKNWIQLRFHAKYYAKLWKTWIFQFLPSKTKTVRHQLKFLSLLRSLVPANDWEPISFKHPQKGKKILNLDNFPALTPFSEYSS